MTSYTLVSGGQVVNPTQVSYSSLSLSVNTTLSWGTEFQNTNPIVAYQMDVSPTTGGLNLTLPNATYVSVGQSFLINNPTGTSFSLYKNDNTLLSTIAGTTINYFYLIDNTTQGGSWRQSPWGGGYTAVTSISANVPTSPSSNNLTVSGVPITTSGTIGLTFAGDLLSLISLGNGVGIAARTAANTWGLTTLTGTNNQIAITNGTGVAGNPTFALASTITGINSLTVGNITISANTITSINENGSLTLESLGTGDVILDPAGTGLIQSLSNITTGAGTGVRFNSAEGGSGYTLITAGNMGTTQVNLTWPTTAPVVGEILQYSGGNALQWAVAPTVTGSTIVNTVPRYDNTGGGLGTSDISIDDSNNITGANSIVTGNLSIAVATPNTIISTNTNGAIVLAPNGAGIIQLDNATTLRNGQSFSFYNVGNTHRNYFSAAVLLGADIGWTLPTADAIVNTNGTATSIPLSSNGAGILSFANTGSIYASGTLTSNEILALYTTPIKLIDAPGVGFMIVIRQFVLQLVYNSIAYTGGGGVYLQYGNTGHSTNYATSNSAIPNAFVQGSTISVIQTQGSLAGTTGLDSTKANNTFISITNDTALFTAGNSTMNWYIWYSIVPIN